MSYFILNIALALGWIIINGAYGTLDIFIGFAIGFLSLWLTQPFGLKSSYFRKFFACFRLAVSFLYEMVVSVLRVAWEVLTPMPLSHPNIIHVPLDVKTDMEITLLANMVSLTPGTLSLDVTKDKKHLIIHAMFAENPDEVIVGIKSGLERKLLEVMRG